MTSSKKVVNFLKDADDIVRLITGKRIPNLIARGIDLLGAQNGETPAPPPPFNPNDPYITLGVRHEASDIVLKAAFRSLAREYHPDTGLHPNASTFQKVTEAYETITKERSKNG